MAHQRRGRFRGWYLLILIGVGIAAAVSFTGLRHQTAPDVSTCLGDGVEIRLGRETLHIGDWPIVRIMLVDAQVSTYDFSSNLSIEGFCTATRKTAGAVGAAALELGFDGMADPTGRGPSWQAAHCGTARDAAQSLLCDAGPHGRIQPWLPVTIWIEPGADERAVIVPNDGHPGHPAVVCDKGVWPVASRRFCIASLAWRNGFAVRYAFHMPAGDQGQAVVLAQRQVLTALTSLFERL